MERGPLPPHERAWRHPSELAAEERELLRAESSSRTTKLLAITSGTLGLLVVGLVMVAITPQRTESPIAVAVATTPVDARSAAPTEPVGLRGDAGFALATPIGDGRFAVVTRASLDGVEGRIIDVLLPSGRTSAGSIVTASDEAVVVALATGEPGHDIARTRPDGTEMVTVMATPPVTVPYDDIESLAVEEGTAVLDDDGDLVGICSRRDGSLKVRLIEVSGELDDATSVVP